MNIIKLYFDNDVVDNILEDKKIFQDIYRGVKYFRNRVCIDVSKYKSLNDTDKDRINSLNPILCSYELDINSSNKLNEMIQFAEEEKMLFIVKNNDMKNTLNEYNVIALNFRECIDGYLLQKIKYPILAADYKTGLVCYFDILGFSSKVYSESKIGFIQDLVFDMQRIINTHELNKLSGNVLFISDSVFYTVEHDENTEAGALINILNLVCLMRKMVVMHVKTDIRCCIAYGKFLHLDSGEIYGPAIIDAVKLVEEKSTDIDESLKDGPASIIIHKNVFDSKLNVNQEINDICLKYNCTPIGEKGYYLVNPFFFQCELETMFETERTKEVALQIYSDEIEIIEANKHKEEKYAIIKKQLEEFKKKIIDK